jgi:hypothetical protein
MENVLVYKIANIFFFIFHIVLILFNLFGWIPRRLRRWNLITLSLTAFSWFILGIFYGLGYCFLTEWHWQVREHLGLQSSGNSYIHFLIVELFGISIEESIVNTFTVIFFFMAVAASIYVNLMRKRKHGSNVK